MPKLLIHLKQGSWVATVENTDVTYVFTGETVEAQLTYVNALAHAMSLGKRALLDEVGSYFDYQATAQVIVDQLFATTDGLRYVAQEFTVDAGSVLLEVVEEAGRWLEAFFP